MGISVGFVGAVALVIGLVKADTVRAISREKEAKYRGESDSEINR